MVSQRGREQSLCPSCIWVTNFQLVSQVRRSQGSWNKDDSQMRYRLRQSFPRIHISCQWSKMQAERERELCVPFCLFNIIPWLAKNPDIVFGLIYMLALGNDKLPWVVLEIWFVFVSLSQQIRQMEMDLGQFPCESCFEATMPCIMGLGGIDLGIMSSFQHSLWIYFVSGTLLSPRALRMTHTRSVVEKSTSVSCSVVSNSLRHHGPYPTRLLCLWNSLGKNTGGGCNFLLQGIFSTQA